MISIVIPAYNEQEVLRELYDQLIETFNNLPMTFEVLLVNDGSSDMTPMLINQISALDPSWKAIHLARRFGQQAAISAGMSYAKGDAVILMDADLQDCPGHISQFIQKWQEGNDVVYAIRRRRKEGIIKKVLYKTFYFILSSVSEIPFPKDVGDFSLMDRKVVNAILSLPEKTRFIRGLRAWVGFKQVGIELERQARFKGGAKHNFKSLMNLALNGIFSYSWVPLRLILGLGLLSVFISVPYLIYILYFKLTGRNPILGWTTIVFIQLALGGLQLLSLGVIGEYLGRTFLETKNRPIYIVSSLVGIDS